MREESPLWWTCEPRTLSKDHVVNEEVKIRMWGAKTPQRDKLTHNLKN